MPALRRGVVGANDEYGSARFQPQRRGEVRPVHGGQPGDERGKSAALQQSGEGGSLFIFEYFLDECVHGLLFLFQAVFFNIAVAPFTVIL